MKEPISKQLEKALQDVQYYKGKYEAVQTELREFESNNEKERRNDWNMMTRQNEEIFSANRQLMEVLRWHINPETAKPLPREGRERDRF